MKNKLKRLLQYLEEQKKLDYQNCDIDAQTVEQLSFVFKNKQYVVVDVYENSYYADELNDEVVEYHFTAQLADQATKRELREIQGVIHQKRCKK